MTAATDPFAELAQLKRQVDEWLSEITYKPGYTFRSEAFDGFGVLTVYVQSKDVEDDPVRVDNVAFGWHSGDTQFVGGGRRMFLTKIREAIREIEFQRINRNLHSLGSQVFEPSGAYRLGAVA